MKNMIESCKPTLFLIFYLAVTEISKCDKINDTFDINKMFPSFQATQQTLNISDVIYKNINIDIEKLDLPKFQKKLSIDLKDKMNEEHLDDMRNRSARRQVLHYTYDRNQWTYFRASRHMTRQKTLDLMLQLIYMARHKVQLLETDPFYSSTDTGFRIGYIFRKLTHLLRKLKDVLQVMKQENAKSDADTKVAQAMIHIKLHQHAVKIHTDFLYLYWVSVKLDGKYRDETNRQPKLVAGYNETGGLTDDDELYQRQDLEKLKIQKFMANQPGGPPGGSG